MIEQIQKFQKGGTSRQRLQDEEAAYRAAYANAGEDARKEADALIQSMSNYSSANPMVGRRNRENQARIYQEATRILTGGERTAPSISGSGADYVINAFYNANKTKTPTSTVAAAPQVMKKFYKYDPYNGLPWSDESDSLEQRVQRLANNLANNLAAARDAHNRGDIVKGIDATQNLDGYIQALDEIANADVIDGRAAQKRILSMARQIGLTDKAQWDDYFGELDDLSLGEKNLLKLKNQGYTDYDMSGYSQWVNKTAKDKKLKFMKDKEGNLKVFNDDWSDYTGGALSLYNDDWTAAPGTGYGDVLLIGDDGNIHMGAVADLDRDSALYNQYTQQLATNRAERDKLFTTHKYNGMFSDAGDNGELFEAISDELGRSFNGADVSGLFSGGEKVFAVQGDGKGEMKADEYGNLRFDGNTRFYSLDDNGKLVRKTWDEMRPMYGRSGFGESETQMGALTDLSHDIRNAETSITGDEDLMGRTFWDALKNSWFGLNPLKNPYVTYAAWDDIKDDPSTFVKLVLDATKNVDGKIDSKYRNINSYIKTNKELLANLDWTNKSKDYTVYMFKYLQQHPEVYNQLSSEQKQQWKELLRRYNGTDTIVEKNGGIIKAAKGTVLSGEGEDITSEASRYKGSKEKAKAKYDELRNKEQKATERGFDSIYAMDANDAEVFGGDAQMKTSDIMRLTTIAQDVASVVASFVPGAGTGVAAGLGVTSMATDLVADILDPAVSGGEVAKNLVVNAGFALAGMIPGAKMGKVAKNVIKWAPRVMTLVAGAGYAMDESVQNTFKKIGEGSTNFTREDWKNISRVFSLAAGAVRTGKGMYDSHKVNKAVVAGDNVTLKGVKSTTADTDLELPKKTVDEINAKLSKAETEEQAKEILKGLKNESDIPIFANDEQIEAALKTPLLSGKKVKVGKYQLVGTEGTVDEGKTYENLRALWDKDATALKKQSETSLGKAAIWFGDKFGGGAYGANQRAIMANADNLGNTLAYKGWYNPMVDWKSLRNQAGMRMMPERVTAETQNVTSGPNSPNNVSPNKTYVNRGTIAESDEMDNAGFSQNWGRIGKTAADEARRIVQQKAGVIIDDNERFLQFVSHLRKNDPSNYKSRLGHRRFMQAAKEEYKFKDGGRINSYSHLRK